MQFPRALLRFRLQRILDRGQPGLCRRQSLEFLLRLHSPVIVIGQGDLASGTVRGNRIKQFPSSFRIREIQLSFILPCRDRDQFRIRWASGTEHGKLRRRLLRRPSNGGRATQRRNHSIKDAHSR